jgi:EAL domain-containing protein (putative c-di-GMP-specific phosphodiesterase class I)
MLGADSAQGFWFSRPVDAQGFSEMLIARKAFPLPVPPHQAAVAHH